MKKWRFLLGYGSETGQSKAIAQGIVDTASEQHKICADLFELDEVDKQFKLEEESVMVIITSSTGDGEPPSNASKFWRKIRREKKSDLLSHMKYTVLGLGDTNYSNFCNCGRVLDRRFEELGASRFYPSTWADDAVGLDLTIEPWLQGLWPALKETLAKLNTSSESSIDNLSQSIDQFNFNQEIKPTVERQLSSCNKFKSDEDSISYSSSFDELTTLTLPPKPTHSLSVKLSESSEESNQVLDGSQYHVAKLARRECLTHDVAIKPVISMELQLSEEEFLFEAGDAIKIVCANDENEVDLLLKRLEWLDKASHRLEISISPDNTKKSTKIPAYIPPMCSLRYALVNCIDIRSSPRKNLLRLFVDCTTDDDEKRRLEELCSREGSEIYIKYILEEHLSILDILNHFPSCKPDVAMLIEFLPSLMPRFYSICSSPLDDARSIKFVYSVFNFAASNGRTYERFGVCTNWLNKIDIGTKVLIQTRISQHFRLPLTLDTPLIMIGPGTGVAPFVGFLDHLYLSSQSISGFDVNNLNTWLFYGCRHREHDFLFQEQLQMYQQINVLKHLFIAASREEGYPFRYVQDQLKINGQELANLICNRNAIIFVCGDIKTMVRDVRETIANILREHTEITNIDEYMKSLETSRRYLLDIWS
ncbi:unnamed protein product [Rotaria magnacalcarata]|uniref:Methionine synthase reductase n=1 Tax=Rotaria magnacalcarata TaxID=392030 RepID=A0A816SRG2_9BILA|nr:unnamed protein product [Rotaria magnacalcarata]CAF3929276.1 unnamed protein product [Rotaria magnacalcarata]